MNVGVLLLLAAAPGSPEAAPYEVVRVERSAAFAGKLGKRLETTLTLTRDGKTYRLRLPNRHTQLSGESPLPAPGSRLDRLPEGRLLQD